MIPRGGFDATASRRRLCGTEATPDVIAGLDFADPVKAFVMRYISQLVACGFATWKLLDNGEVELKFTTGETFILSEDAIVRLV
jgi:hypothetical protein